MIKMNTVKIKFHLQIKQHPYSSRLSGTKSFVSPDRTTYKMSNKEIALINKSDLRGEERGGGLTPTKFERLHR